LNGQPVAGTLALMSEVRRVWRATGDLRISALIGGFFACAAVNQALIKDRVQPFVMFAIFVLFFVLAARRPTEGWLKPLIAGAYSCTFIGAVVASLDPAADFTTRPAHASHWWPASPAVVYAATAACWAIAGLIAHLWRTHKRAGAAGATLARS
jgi:hypothetical protein